MQFIVTSWTLVEEESYFSAKMLSTYFSAPFDYADHTCTKDDWSFLVILLNCCPLYISKVRSRVASLLLQIVNARSSLPGRWLFEFSPLLEFVRLLSIPHLSFSMSFGIKFMTSLDIWYIFKHSIIHAYGTILKAFLLSFHAMASYFRLVLVSLMMCWSMNNRLFVVRRHTFCSPGKSLLYANE